MSKFWEYYDRDPNEHPLVDDLIKFTSKTGHVSQALAEHCSRKAFQQLKEKTRSDYSQIQRTSYASRWAASDAIIDDFEACINSAIPSEKKKQKVDDFAHATFKTLLRV
mgnify:CR=1 FL=1